MSIALDLQILEELARESRTTEAEASALRRVLDHITRMDKGIAQMKEVIAYFEAITTGAEQKRINDIMLDDEIALAVLDGGESAAGVARRFGCSREKVIRLVRNKAMSHERYNYDEFLEQLRDPSTGILKTSIIMWKKWNSITTGAEQKKTSALTTGSEQKNAEVITLRDEIALCVLDDGENVTKVARRFGCSRHNVLQCVDEQLQKHERYDSQEYLDQLRVIGSGRLTTATTLWKRWNEALLMDGSTSIR